MTPMRRFTVSLDQGDLNGLEALRADMGARSLAEAVRRLIRRAVVHDLAIGIAAAHALTDDRDEAAAS